MWKRIHRIILKEIFAFFFIVLAIFLFLFITGKFLRLSETLIFLNLSLLDLLKLILYLSPFSLFILFPIGCMLAIFLTFQRMETDREILILKTSGISLYQLLPAPFCFLTFCFLCHLFISLYFMPYGLKNFQKTMLDMAKKKAELSIKPGFFNKEISSMVLYVQDIDRKKGMLKNIFIERKDENGSLNFIIAPYGSIDQQTDKLGKIFFSFFKGKIYSIPSGSFDKWNIIEFGRYLIFLDLTDFFKKIEIKKDKSELFFLSEMKKILKNARAHTKFYRKIEVERYKRFSLPFADFVLGIFAMLLAWIFYGIKRQLGILLMIFVFFLFYSIFSFSLNLGKIGYLSPFWAAWLPDLLFSAINLFLFSFSKKVR